MKLLRIALAVLFIAAGVEVLWSGVVEFDNATSLIPFLRGAFWMAIGGLSFRNGLNGIKNQGVLPNSNEGGEVK
jgi:hypothetical protein